MENRKNTGRKSTAVEGTTAQQKLFAHAFFNNKGNGTQAAITAGYSKKTAESQASRLLSKAKVQKIISDLNSKLEEKAIITKERVLQELANIGLFDLRTLYNEQNCLKDIASMSDAAGAAITSIDVDQMFEWVDGSKEHVGNTTKVKMASKIAALDSIRDMMGWKAPTKVAATDPDGKAVPQSFVFNLPPGMNISLPSNTDSDDTEG